MVTVEMAVRVVVAVHLAALQTAHLPDEVFDSAFTLTVHRLTPGTPVGAGAGTGAGGGCGGGAAGRPQY